MFDQPQTERLREGLAAATEPLELTVHLGGDETSFLARSLRALVGEIEALGAEKAMIRSGVGGSLPATPALTLASGSRGDIHYMALPEGLEAEPFLDLLLDLASGGPSKEAGWAGRLAALERDVELLVFVSSACPHCAQAVRTAGALALASPHIRTYIVDAQRLPDLAARFHAQSVPLTLIDSGLGFTGAVTARELVEKILAVGTPEHEERVFLSMIEGARFEDAANRIVEADGAKQFAAAWQKSAMSLRMGLLLLAERVLTSDPHALDSIVESLLPALSAEDAALRGDTADLLGHIRHQGALPALEARIDDPDGDVAEAVRDALEQIRERRG